MYQMQPAYTANIVRNFFDDDFALDLRTRLNTETFDTEYCEVTDRQCAQNVPMLVDIHRSLTDRATTIFGQQVKSSYVFLSCFSSSGLLPPHVDREQCAFTIDYCIDQRAPWPLFVDHVAFELERNDALCFSGTDSIHWRNRISPGNFCHMALFHFVPMSFGGSLD